MGESSLHMKLVTIAHEQIRKIVPQSEWNFIAVDSPDTPKPQQIAGNFIPDVLLWRGNVLVIGEAKTHNDFQTLHSQEQYKAYLETCSSFDGDSTFVIAVPWELFLTAKHFFSKKKQEMGISTRIIIVNQIQKKAEI